jgi:hypothetical protein
MLVGKSLMSQSSALPNAQSMYDEYTKVVQASLLDFQDPNRLGFKSNREYNRILEHVSAEEGLDYLDHIRAEFGSLINKALDFCKMNDQYGKPHVYSYDRFGNVSPTSLRYVFHSLLILKYLKELGRSEYDIVEVAVGYGGLCLALHYFAPEFGIKINSYHLADLKPVMTLAKSYLNLFSIKAETADENSLIPMNAFFISNYGFGEFSEEWREFYRQTVLSECSHGFLVFNNPPCDPATALGKAITRIEPERPRTGDNRFVYF